MAIKTEQAGRASRYLTGGCLPQLETFAKEVPTAESCRLPCQCSEGTASALLQRAVPRPTLLAHVGTDRTDAHLPLWKLSGHWNRPISITVNTAEKC